jgi:hypothetical protein
MQLVVNLACKYNNVSSNMLFPLLCCFSLIISVTAMLWLDCLWDSLYSPRTPCLCLQHYAVDMNSAPTRQVHAALPRHQTAPNLTDVLPPNLVNLVIHRASVLCHCPPQFSVLMHIPSSVCCACNRSWQLEPNCSWCCWGSISCVWSIGFQWSCHVRSWQFLDLCQV